MVRCLWRVMCVDSRFVVLVMTMKEVKGTSAVLSATLAISVKRVSLSCSNFVSFLYKHHVFNENGTHYIMFSGFLSPGCPRVAGDEENFDADDSDDEFQIKSRPDDSEKQHAINHSVISYKFQAIYQFILWDK